MMLGYPDKCRRDFAAGKRVKAFEGFARQACLAFRLLDLARTARTLNAIPRNHFEALKDDRKGQYCICVNRQWRVCFEWPDTDIGPSQVEIVDYHWEVHMPRRAGPPIHPGELLARELKELQVLPSQLAAAIGVPPNRISQILKGKRDVTADTALRLGHWFGTGPEIWIDMQRDHDLRIAQESLRETLKSLPRRPNISAEGKSAAALR